ncbi:hypothetical protein [Streptomyces beihaiensis]|uniref:Uncharacterized protein n=1 Tax=Streptomyces beihaiensis TaxID=2984495 RepID=A0ABT3U363_9ACTN|nr:hypothetical protein [Streptomyces beihaiensis]MCX3063759.1 hypothetical protein [Streptomyces beihaiensis]
MPGSCGAAAAVGTVGTTTTTTADPYVYGDGARTVRGAHGAGDAARLSTARTYRSSIGVGSDGTAYYRVDLDGAADAYASVVAVPPLGSGVKVSYADGITVTLRDSAGHSCGTGRATFSTGAYPRPVAAVAERKIRAGATRCQAAGTYYLVVRRQTDADSTRETWGLELSVATEPGLVTPEPAQGPSAWPSGSAPSLRPSPSGGGAPRAGGTGFNDAAAVNGGVWRDRVRPGESHFFRVPVDWGQQLFLDAGLKGAAGDRARRGYVPGALDVQLYNPARAPVAEKEAGYAGDAASATLDPLPPVAYENRHLLRTDRAAMRFAGWYYVKVGLDPAMARTFGDRAYDVTLRVTVRGKTGRAPDYVRDPGPFQVTDADRQAAARGVGGADWGDRGADDGSGPGSGPGGNGSGSDSGSAGSIAGPGAGRSGGGRTSATPAATSTGSSVSARMLVGVGGIGTGTALVLWLGVWRMVSVRRFRRRVARHG